MGKHQFEGFLQAVRRPKSYKEFMSSLQNCAHLLSNVLEKQSFNCVFLFLELTRK